MGKSGIEQKDITLEKDSSSAEACYNIIKDEYIHTFARSEKLDNKVYIALTIYAFIFLFVIENIGYISEINFPENTGRLVLFIIYIVITLIMVAVFLVTLIKLASLLKPMKVQRIDPKFYTENQVQTRDVYTIYTYTFKKYQEVIEDNSIELEKRFNEYYVCVNGMIAIVILSFGLGIFKLFI